MCFFKSYPFHNNNQAADATWKKRRRTQTWKDKKRRKKSQKQMAIYKFPSLVLLHVHYNTVTDPETINFNPQNKLHYTIHGKTKAKEVSFHSFLSFLNDTTIFFNVYTFGWVVLFVWWKIYLYTEEVLEDGSQTSKKKLLFPKILLIMVLNSVKNNNNTKCWWYYFGITGINFIRTLSFIYFYCLSFSLNSFNSSIYIDDNQDKDIEWEGEMSITYCQVWWKTRTIPLIIIYIHHNVKWVLLECVFYGLWIKSF